MNDLERQLKSIPTATPDDSHDRRMDRLFFESERPRAWFSKPIPLWQGVAACVLALAMGYLYRGTQTPDASPPQHATRTVYIVPATPEFQRAIQGAGQSRPIPEESGSYVIEVSPGAVNMESKTGDAT